MNTVIYSFFISMALRMSVITFFVIVIKLFFRDKLSAGAHCILWLMLPIQTLFCVANIKIPSRTSIYNAMPEIDIPVMQSAPTAVDFRNIIALIYLLGITVIALWYLSVYVIHFVKVKRMEKVNCDELTAVKAQLGINNSIIICRGAYAHTISNIVVLPQGYSSDEISQILVHELCHYKHKDNMKLWIAVGVVCLNWFNPIVWYAFRRFRLDIEMYCDESVLKYYDNKKAYARILVKTATGRIGFVPGISGAANGTHEVSKRVKRIANLKKKKTVWLIAAAFAAVCVSCLCLTNAVTEAVKKAVPEVVDTPDAADDVSELVEAVIPVPTETAIVVPTAMPTQKPISGSRQTKKTLGTVEASAPVAQSTPTPTAVPTQAPVESEPSESEVVEWTEMGERTSVSANGSKETYKGKDGSTVILQYNEGKLQTGYIIEQGE